MRAVLDASVAILLALDPARDTVRQMLSGYEELLAPTHFDVEVAAGLRRCWIRQEITREEFVLLATRFTMAPVTRVDIARLMPRIVALADNATPHDAAYIALAESTESDFITSDRRLLAVPGVGCRIRQFP